MGMKITTSMTPSFSTNQKGTGLRWVQVGYQPPTKRARIAAACFDCKTRKIRCKGERPTCSTCRDAHRTCTGYKTPHKKAPDNPAVRVNGTGHDQNGPAQEVDIKDSLLSPPLREAKVEDLTPAGESLMQQSFLRPEYLDHFHGDADYTPNHSNSLRCTTDFLDFPRSPQEFDPFEHGVGEDHRDGDVPVYSPDGEESTGVPQRVPYFRYFGATAIVPGYKQMLAKTSHAPRRTTSIASAGASMPCINADTHAAEFTIASPGSGADGTDSSSPGSTPSQVPSNSRYVFNIPDYDPKDKTPVHELILSLIDIFFVHLGCNYPFLYKNKDRFRRHVESKEEEPILVNVVCALAARFSDHELLKPPHGEVSCKSTWGKVFAVRARNDIVWTFHRPTVKATQACLLLAYEAFGSDEDSALWMFLGCAIRMAEDLGLHKHDVVKHRAMSQSATDVRPPRNVELSVLEESLSEEERLDTFWAVLVLDRFISSGVGRPGTLRRTDMDLTFPSIASVDSAFPALLFVMRDYGTIADRMNVHVKQTKEESLPELFTKFSKWGTQCLETCDFREKNKHLEFNLANMRRYDSRGEGINFVLFHLWLHTMVMLLLRPSLMSPYDRDNDYVSKENHNRCIKSANIIVELLQMLNTHFPGTVVRNPFTSQPIYIAACAWLKEKERHGDEAQKQPAQRSYMICYRALQQLRDYWAGIGYILVALDQKHSGVRPENVQTFDESRIVDANMSTWASELPSGATQSSDHDLRSSALDFRHSAFAPYQGVMAQSPIFMRSSHHSLARDRLRF